MFSKEDLFSEAKESNILANAAKKARETPTSINRAKREAQAWSEVGNKVVGGEIKDNDPLPSLQDALRNMLGAFDTPLTRVHMGSSWTSFHEEAVKSARDAINNGNPLYSP